MSDQVTALQALNTSLTNEVRMLRAQLGAAKAVMRVGLIERPMTQAMSPTGASCEDLVKLYERIELLEKDAWTQTGALAKQFVKEALEHDVLATSQDATGPVNFIQEWREKFKNLVGD